MTDQTLAPYLSDILSMCARFFWRCPRSTTPHRSSQGLRGAHCSSGATCPGCWGHTAPAFWAFHLAQCCTEAIWCASSSGVSKRAKDTEVCIWWLTHRGEMDQPPTTVPLSVHILSPGALQCRKPFHNAHSTSGSPFPQPPWSLSRPPDWWQSSAWFYGPAVGAAAAAAYQLFSMPSASPADLHHWRNPAHSSAFLTFVIASRSTSVGPAAIAHLQARGKLDSILAGTGLCSLWSAPRTPPALTLRLFCLQEIAWGYQWAHHPPAAIDESVIKSCGGCPHLSQNWQWGNHHYPPTYPNCIKGVTIHISCSFPHFIPYCVQFIEVAGEWKDYKWL